MARGRAKAKRRSRPRGFRVLAGLEAAAYASILSKGLMGTSIFGLFGKEDITVPVTAGIVDLSPTYYNPDGAVTLADLVGSPDLAIMAIMDNARANLLPMAMASIATGVSFRIAKSVLRRPLSSVQRNLINPILGKGLIRVTA